MLKLIMYKNGLKTPGLKPLKSNWNIKRLRAGKKDFSHYRTFGASPISDLPDEYLLVSTILDQGQNPYCTAYSGCSIRASEAGVEFDPIWFYQQEGIVAGEISNTGYDLRVVMKTGIQVGFKPLQGGTEPKTYAADGYFAVDGPKDTYDNIKLAMWQAKEEKRCIEVGMVWYIDWLNPELGGVVPESYTRELGAHALKGAGWTTKKRDGSYINPLTKEEHYVIQNSFGEQYGDRGLFYFTRKQVNKLFNQGLFVWRLKPDEEQIKKMTLIIFLMNKVINLYKQLLNIK